VGSFQEAIDFAEAEAQAYGAAIGLEYLHFVQVFHQKSESVGHGSEVFSLIRDSTPSPNEYINRFFETGSERERAIELRRLRSGREERSSLQTLRFVHFEQIQSANGADHRALERPMHDGARRLAPA
jgi:hypothetical protein